MSAPRSRAIIEPLFLGAHRRHEIEQQDGRWLVCPGLGFCPICNRESREPYMSDETKKILRDILEEHLGPAAKEIGDQDDLDAKHIEFVNIAIALETQLEVRISESALRCMKTIDGMARYLDTLLASKRASAS